MPTKYKPLQPHAVAQQKNKIFTCMLKESIKDLNEIDYDYSIIATRLPVVTNSKNQNKYVTGIFHILYSIDADIDSLELLSGGVSLIKDEITINNVQIYKQAVSVWSSIKYKILNKIYSFIGIPKFIDIRYGTVQYINYTKLVDIDERLLKQLKNHVVESLEYLSPEVFVP